MQCALRRGVSGAGRVAAVAEADVPQVYARRVRGWSYKKFRQSRQSQIFEGGIMAGSRISTNIVVAVIGAVGLIAGNLASSLVSVGRIWPFSPTGGTINFAVMRSDVKPENRAPIAGADVSINGVDSPPSEAVVERTNQGGSVTIPFGNRIRQGDLITITFHKQCYQDFSETIAAAADLPFTRYMWPSIGSSPECNDPIIEAINIGVRGDVLQRSTAFLVMNRGTVGCRKQPCSPDGKWQANIGSGKLDAGVGNAFEPGKASVRCIAGPCPFTQVVADGYSKGGQTISAVVKDWSDTVTFILQGTLVGPQTIPAIAISGSTFAFTVKTADISKYQIVATIVGGPPIVDPLGVGTITWAHCDIGEGQDTATYHCALNNNYSFAPK